MRYLFFEAVKRIEATLFLLLALPVLRVADGA
jgi:hypothetical protein